MNNTMLTNSFNNDNSNIINIKKQHCQVLATTTDTILKFEAKIKKAIAVNHTFFVVVTIIIIKSFA